MLKPSDSPNTLPLLAAVNDKHGKPLNWKNVMDSQVTELPNNITNNFVDGKNLFSQHFMLTSLDQNSGVSRPGVIGTPKRF